MTKICSKCKIEKPFDEFWKKKDTKDGLQTICRDCQTAYNKIYNQENAEAIAARNKIYNKIYNQENAEAIAARKKIYSENNAEAIAARHSVWRKLHFYNLNDEDYQQMLLDQNNSCKTCKIEFDSTSYYTKPNIDHDHKCCEGKRSCGKCVRGILCGSCNLLFGKVKDSIQTLQNMINYLKEYA